MTGVEKRHPRPRRVRASSTLPILITEKDAWTIEMLFLFGALSTPALLVLRDAFDPLRAAPPLHDARRLTELMHAGYLSRFDPKRGWLAGSSSFLYAVECRAMEAVRTCRHYMQIDATTWSRILSDTTPARTRLLELLVSRGYPLELVESKLESATKMCLRFYSGEVSQLAHRALGGTAAVLLLAGARARGLPVAPIRSDGNVVFGPPDGPVKPDCFLGIGAFGVALEAETGMAGRGKVVQKVRGYVDALRQPIAALRSAAGMPQMEDIYVLFHAATAGHARLLADVIASEGGEVADRFRVTGPTDLSVDLLDDGTRIPRDTIAKNDQVRTGLSARDYFRNRIAAPIFARYHRGAWEAVPLLDACGTAISTHSTL